MTTALVTGASAGLGREFATQLAARGHDLVLVARDRRRLEEVAAQLGAAYGIAVEVLSADLSDREQLGVVADRVRDEARPIDVLVNNAGYGMTSAFAESDLRAEEAAFDVMCRAVLVLCHAAAPGMLARGHGRMINVSSVAGYIATSTYSAAKAYVTVFSESLAGSLAGSGVSVTALCPGFVHTEFHDRARIDTSPLPGFAWLDAPDVVREALADAGKGRVVSVPSRRYRAVVLLLKLAPRALARNRSLVSRHRP